MSYNTTQHRSIILFILLFISVTSIFVIVHNLEYSIFVNLECLWMSEYTSLLSISIIPLQIVKSRNKKFKSNGDKRSFDTTTKIVATSILPYLVATGFVVMSNYLYWRLNSFTLSNNDLLSNQDLATTHSVGYSKEILNLRLYFINSYYAIFEYTIMFQLPQQSPTPDLFNTHLIELREMLQTMGHYLYDMKPVVIHWLSNPNIHPVYRHNHNMAYVDVLRFLRLTIMSIDAKDQIGTFANLIELQNALFHLIVGTGVCLWCLFFPDHMDFVLGANEIFMMTSGIPCLFRDFVINFDPEASDLHLTFSTFCAYLNANS